MFRLILTCWSVSHVHRFLKLKEINQQTRIPTIKVLQGSVIIATGIELEEVSCQSSSTFHIFFYFSCTTIDRLVGARLYNANVNNSSFFALKHRTRTHVMLVI